MQRGLRSSALRHHSTRVRTAWFARAVGIWLLSVFGMVATARPSFAQNTLRIAYINSERILDGYKERGAILASFSQDVEGWNQEALTKKRELDEVGRELAQQSPMLSDEKRREKEQDYQRKLTDYDAYVQKIWGADGLVTQRNEEVLRPIVQKIHQIVADIAEVEKYDLIFDAADGNLVYGAPTLDLSQQVIDRLNADVPSETPP
ncbi:MAG: OmpH family outer membrane protein [Candidatus Eisenbacteria bacterium]